MLLSRKDKILFHCDLTGTGLEIGPSYNPVAPKKSGYHVEVLDHADAQTLREKYRSHNVDINTIEEVDYVWKGEPLHELTDKAAYYEWIIASHVIEHTPDLVSFIQQCEIMLKSGGILSLAIPDHRYCFDVFRPVSTSGEVIQAFLEKRKRHSFGAIFDHFSMGATKQGALGWDKGTPGEYRLLHNTIDHAQWMLSKALLSDEEYIDIHNWRFTPSSFKLIISDICALQYTNMEMNAFFETEGFEFICQLRKNENSAKHLPTSVNRRDLLLEILKENHFLGRKNI